MQSRLFLSLAIVCVLLASAVSAEDGLTNSKPTRDQT